jgi:hypothetical protein
MYACFVLFYTLFCSALVTFATALPVYYNWEFKPSFTNCWRDVDRGITDLRWKTTISIDIDIDRGVTDLCWKTTISIDIERYRLISIDIERYRLISIDIERYRLISNDIDWYRTIRGVTLFALENNDIDWYRYRYRTISIVASRICVGKQVWILKICDSNLPNVKLDFLANVQTALIFFLRGD